MKKLVILPILVLTISLGCISSILPSNPIPDSSTVNILVSPGDNSTSSLPLVIPIPISSNTTSPFTSLPQYKEPNKKETWISPGKVNVSNYYPGALAEWPLLVHNGSSNPAGFYIAYREPSYVAEGFSKTIFPTPSWIVVSDPTPLLSANETRSILVTLKMPVTAKNYPSRWEYWVSVIDTTRLGSIKTELCSRWLIVMR